MGPILVQLPPHFAAVPERLDQTLSQFPRGTRVAVEFRDQGWFTDEVRSILERRRTAFVLAD